MKTPFDRLTHAALFYLRGNLIEYRQPHYNLTHGEIKRYQEIHKQLFHEIGEALTRKIEQSKQVDIYENA